MAGCGARDRPVQSQRDAAERRALQMVEHITGADATPAWVSALRLVLAAAIDAGTRQPG